MQHPIILGAIAAAISVSPAFAQNGGDHGIRHVAQKQAESPAAKLSEGEVRKVDKEGGKVTLKHGPIENLGMPPMTMVFKVQDPTMLDQVKAGDKVRFRAEQIAGQYTLTQIVPAQ